MSSIRRMLPTTAWAFATANYLHEKLFAALATAAGRRLSKFNPQNVANTAWAFATVNCRDQKLFAALVIAAERVNPAGCCEHGMGMCNRELPR